MVSTKDLGILALVGIVGLSLFRSSSSNVFASSSIPLKTTPVLENVVEELEQEDLEPVQEPILTRLQKLVKSTPEGFFGGGDKNFNPIRRFVGQRCFNCGATPTFTREFARAGSLADLSSGVRRVVSTRATRAGFSSDVLFFNFTKGFLNKQLDAL